MAETQTHPDGSDSRYATITEPEPEPLSLVSPSVPTSQFQVVLTWCLPILVLMANLRFFNVSYTRFCPRMLLNPVRLGVHQKNRFSNSEMGDKWWYQLIDSALVSDVDVEKKELINPGK